MGRYEDESGRGKHTFGKRLAQHQIPSGLTQASDSLTEKSSVSRSYMQRDDGKVRTGNGFTYMDRV